MFTLYREQPVFGNGGVFSMDELLRIFFLAVCRASRASLNGARVLARPLRG
ncbi:hypothetical protein [Acetobacter persici]|uniref:hypothetical protein n=1 Tax=Acetobacter persici TaxID=1076596 RepID=UPI0012FE33B3|nr:hypothetical protein [Acetobacter persici]